MKIKDLFFKPKSEEQNAKIGKTADVSKDNVKNINNAGQTEKSKKSGTAKQDSMPVNTAITTQNADTMTDGFETDGFVVEEKEKKVFRKPTYDEKLTILMVENTLETAKEKDNVIKIVKSLVTSGYVSVVNYGGAVRKSEPEEVKKFDDSILFCNYDLSDKSSLYEAIFDAEYIVDKYRKKLIEEETKKSFIKYVEIIGIGQCIDTCSKVSKEISMSCFHRIANLSNVTTKYFCLTDATFVNAATIGFHSIGAINRSYK